MTPASELHKLSTCNENADNYLGWGEWIQFVFSGRGSGHVRTHTLTHSHTHTHTRTHTRTHTHTHTQVRITIPIILTLLSWCWVSSQNSDFILRIPTWNYNWQQTQNLYFILRILTWKIRIGSLMSNECHTNNILVLNSKYECSQLSCVPHMSLVPLRSSSHTHTHTHMLWYL